MISIFKFNQTNNAFSIISNEKIEKLNGSNKNNKIINHLINDNNKIKLNKKAIKFKSSINQNNKNNVIFIFLITFILLINKILCESYIILKINKSGTRNIFFHWGIEDIENLCSGVSMHKPTLMIINGKTIEIPVGIYSFVEKNNTIKLVYDDSKESYQCLFYRCSDIDEIDASHLITSNVKNMLNMFSSCTSLTSLDISNFNTEKVTSMNGMFYYCSNLKHLYITNFITSSVTDMGWMFCGCYSLESLDITNFNTKKVRYMKNMFGNCYSLTTLDLTHFDTSLVTDMSYMFYYCKKLDSIDISHFNTTSTKEFDYMFYGCKSLKSLDVTKFNTAIALNMTNMFGFCTSLTNLDLSKFVTSNVKNMSEMFVGCSSLISLDISKFDTPQVTNMNRMFDGCSSLQSLDISKFNTSQVTDMNRMFNGCTLLQSLDVSKFDTSQVTDMYCMFSGCSSLKNIDLSKFQTTNVLNMTGLFEKCSNLISIDLSKFITSSVIKMNSMFKECTSLQSLDLSKFDTSNVIDMSYMFDYCNNLKSLNLINFNTENVENMEWMFCDCHKLESLDISSFRTPKVNSMAEMFAKCQSLPTLDVSKFDTSQVTNVLSMFEGCSILKSLDLSKFRTSSIKNMRYMLYNNKQLISLDLSNFDFSEVTDMQYMFTSCPNLKYINLKNSIINNNIQQSSNIDNAIINLIICINDQQSLNKIISLPKCQYLFELENIGEYQDKIINEDNKYKKGCLLTKNDENCYQICSFNYYYDENQNKLIYGTNECIKSCSQTKDYQYEFVLGKVCLTKCPEYFYTSTNKPFVCIPKCSLFLPFLLVEKLECVLHCTIKERQKKLCITDYHYSKENNYLIFDEVVSQTRDELLNNFDSSVVNWKIINEDGDNITITRTQQEDKGDNGIYLGDCEKRLKEIYNIPQNQALYVLRLDIRQIGYQKPSLQYEILYPIDNNKNLVKLNLSICSDINLNITLEVDIEGNIDKYTKNSPYYNDICYLSDSDNEVDISFTDKKEDFIDNNLGICEDGCDFISYNYETKKAVCSCGIKTEIPLMNDVKIDRDTLLNSFKDIDNIANTKLMQCFNVIFQKKYILKNIGFYIYASLIVLNLACFLYFIIKDYKALIKEIDKIKLDILTNKKKSINNNETNNIQGKQKGKIRLNTNDIKSNLKKLNNKDFKKDGRYLTITSKPIFILPPIYKGYFNYNKFYRRNLIPYVKEKSSNNSNNYFLINKVSIQNNLLGKLNYNEINDLPFKEALKKDNRNYIQYYLSLLKTKHSIIYIFYTKDYNSQIIKVSIQIFNLATLISVNSLFFNDSTMHKIYVDQGSFDLIYQLPQIIYSAIISWVLNSLIQLLGLTEDNILNFKNDKYPLQNLNQKYNKLITIIKIKLAFFYILNISILVLYWYYVTCFCGIYRNTQIHLLKDSLYSYIFSLITPFGIYIFPSIFRILALRRKSKILYILSKLLQML